MLGIEMCSREAARILVEAIEAAASNQMVYSQVSDLSAGGDLSGLIVFYAPSEVTISELGFLAQGVFAGIDNSNTMVVTVTDGDDNVLVTKTYNTATQPVDETYNNLGAVDAQYATLAEGGVLKLTITNGSTANPPAMILVTHYAPTI